MPLAEFENAIPAIPAFERRQSYVLDVTATGIGYCSDYK
jgi:hypothetical protein